MSIRSTGALSIAAALLLAVPTAAAAAPSADPRGQDTAATRRSENEARREAREADREARDADRTVRGRSGQATPGGSSADHRRDGDAGNATSRRGREVPAVGNSGTIKVSAVDEVPDPSNEPHPGCGLRADFYGFRAGTFDLTISTHAPTGSDQLLADDIVLSESARGNTLQLTEVYDVGSLLPPSDDGRWHLRVEVARDGQPGNGAKSKMLWLECPVDAGGLSAPNALGGSRGGAADAEVLGTFVGAPAAAADGIDVVGRVAAPTDDLATTGGAAMRSMIWIALALLSLGLGVAMLNKPRELP